MNLDEAMEAGSTKKLTEKILEHLDFAELNKAEFHGGRAVVLVSVITRVLVFLRGRGNFGLDAESFVSHLDLDRLRDLCVEEKHRGAMFDAVCRPLRAYLAQVTEEHHKFMAAQVARAFSSWGSGGHAGTK